MVPWWAALGLFFVGIFVGAMIIILMNAERGD